MIYILFGENSYSRQQFLAETKRELGLVDSDATIFSGTQLTPAQLANTVNTIPFLTSHRLVIVEGLLGRFEPPKTAKEEATPRELVQSFTTAAQPAIPTTILIFIDDEVSTKKNPLFKALAPLAEVKPFPLLWGEKLQSWIKDQVTKKGGTIMPAAVKNLANLAGNDLWALSNEIDKLMLYSEGQPIQEKHIQEVVAPAQETNIFHLVDALLQRRSIVASRQLHQLLFRGMAPPQLIVLIARQLRLLVLTQEFRAQRLPETEIQKRLGVADFVFRRLLVQAKQYTLPQLTHAYKMLLDTDLAIKTGRQDDVVALDVLATELGRNR